MFRDCTVLQQRNKYNPDFDLYIVLIEPYRCRFGLFIFSANHQRLLRPFAWPTSANADQCSANFFNMMFTSKYKTIMNVQSGQTKKITLDPLFRTVSQGSPGP